MFPRSQARALAHTSTSRLHQPSIQSTSPTIQVNQPYHQSSFDREHPHHQSLDIDDPIRPHSLSYHPRSIRPRKTLFPSWLWNRLAAGRHTINNTTKKHAWTQSACKQTNSTTSNLTLALASDVERLAYETNAYSDPQVQLSPYAPLHGHSVDPYYRFRLDCQIST